ncbi:hypothetical protein J7K25_03415 [bacterium]|nr:hypothetical protein [bacterium]
MKKEMTKLIIGFLSGVLIIIMFFLIGPAKNKEKNVSVSKSIEKVSPTEVIKEKLIKTEKKKEKIENIPSEKKEKLKKLIKGEKKEKKEWLKKILALNEKYKDKWEHNSYNNSSLSVGMRSSTGSKFTPTYSSPQKYNSSPIYSSRISSTTSSSNIKKSNKGDNNSSSSMGGTPITSGPSTEYSGNSSAPNTGENEGNNNENDENNNEEDNNNNPEILTITRSISTFSGGANVSLNIEIKQNISGLIITETIPANYTITNSSPKYAKKTDKTYKWLFYGRGISSQTINYTLQGEGGGKITGSYKTTAGKGTITGQSTL